MLSESNLDDFVDVRVLVRVEGARDAAVNRTDAIIVQLEASPELTVFTAFGRDLGTACTLLRRLDAPGRLGRQTQVWARIDG